MVSFKLNVFENSDNDIGKNEYESISFNFRNFIDKICVPVSKTFGIESVGEFPQYVKLSKDYISELTLEYTPELYKSSFLEGTIISTLHFRRVNGL